MAGTKLVVVAVTATVLAVTGSVFVATYPRAGRGLAYAEHCSKVWAHRGIHQTAAENSMAAVREAFDRGACGVEVDIIYDPAPDELFVISEEARDGGERPSLALGELLTSIPAVGYVWLDFWNLKSLDAATTQRAVDQLVTHLRAHDAVSRTIVESVDADKLLALKARGLHTSLWVSIAPPRSGRLQHHRDLLRAARSFGHKGFSAVSMDYRSYSSWVKLTFAQVPIYVFTIDDPNVLQYFASETGVKVILSDRPSY